ncbi:acyltransferase family protein [Saccharothrix obliqua]|uniref:acyltransferase family protein n=1 Tax=Saccharothrix obliqua TaxID=2861747 RepID=UPI001C5FAD9A|nr:acyltransferase [Saccharothrix obliqua]MBW4722362.1 acyltransferase [Saccharothrix obliqua]
MVTTTPARDATGKLPVLPSLAGLRFVAAVIVFLNHVMVSASPIPPHGPLTPYADPELNRALAWVLMPVGYTAVVFFFVLTGFVITWSARPGERPTAFWRRRALKLYPNHVVMWVLTMVLYAGAVTPLSSWLPNLLLVQAFFPSFAVFFSVNEPSWALCCDLLFYALFPLLVVLVRRLPERRLWLCAGAVVVAAVSVPFLAAALLPEAPGLFGSSVSVPRFWAGFVFPPTQLLTFGLGMVLARIVMTGRRLPLGVKGAVVAVVLGYAVSQSLPLEFQFAVAPLVPAGLLVAAVAAADARGRRSWLGSPLMRRLGDLSFGFYICQGVLLYCLRPLLGADTFFSVPVGTAVLLGLLAVNLAGGWLLFTFVETPVMRRWARKPVRRGRPQSGVDGTRDHGREELGAP